MIHQMTRRGQKYSSIFFINVFSSGELTGAAKQSQGKCPEGRGATDTTKRIPGGPRNQQYQAYLPTETTRGDKTKTSVRPLLSHMRVLHSHAMQQCVGVFSRCVLKNTWLPFQYNAVLLIRPFSGNSRRGRSQRERRLWQRSFRRSSR